MSGTRTTDRATKAKVSANVDASLPGSKEMPLTQVRNENLKKAEIYKFKTNYNEFQKIQPREATFTTYSYGGVDF